LYKKKSTSIRLSGLYLRPEKQRPNQTRNCNRTTGEAADETVPCKRRPWCERRRVHRESRILPPCKRRPPPPDHPRAPALAMLSQQWRTQDDKLGGAKKTGHDNLLIYLYKQ
jgi:hypothetical protein